MKQNANFSVDSVVVLHEDTSESMTTQILSKGKINEEAMFTFCMLMAESFSGFVNRKLLSQQQHLSPFAIQT